MLYIYEYEEATKEECELDLADILDCLDTLLQVQVNYGLYTHDVDALEMKGKRIIEIAKRLRVLNEKE